jgi:UDP-N-acetylmuramoylalanine--D-glutamate ligase
MIFKNKKVLLVGLGILGGGVGTANLLLKEGALLAITDLKSKLELKNSISKIKASGKKINYTLGRHDEKDFKRADVIVFNQSVPYSSRWVQYTKKLNKPIESDLTIFSHKIKNNNATFIGITGTRGKTTTSHWLSHFLPKATMGGNMPNKGLSYLATLKKKLYVLELSSFQLEYSNSHTMPPKIAIVTNLYIDHLNYHGSLKKYFEAKFNLFKYQTKNDFLIINRDNKYTSLILKQKPKSKIYFFSLSPLSKNQEGIFGHKDEIFFQESGKKIFICKTIKEFSGHRLSNLLPAMLAAYLYQKNSGVGPHDAFRGPTPQVWKNVCSMISGIPEVPLRQELILETKNLKVINDGAATSPEAAIAAIERFNEDKNFVLITGGTDKQLDFKDLAKKIKQTLSPSSIYFLQGSATDKLIKNIGWKKVRTFAALKDIVSVLPTTGTIVFSPGAASFEKFKNEFDRAHQFNKLIKARFGATLRGR